PVNFEFGLLIIIIKFAEANIFKTRINNGIRFQTRWYDYCHIIRLGSLSIFEACSNRRINTGLIADFYKDFILFIIKPFPLPIGVGLLTLAGAHTKGHSMTRAIDDFSADIIALNNVFIKKLQSVH